MNNQTLEEKITAAISLGFIPISINEACVEPAEMSSSHIKNNLNHRLPLRPYQAEAFARFRYYTESYPDKTRPVQLLFHMATGSGKTLIMAGCILDLYKKGYRNFIFFVNSTNIIEKTKDNFLNPLSSKYLFNETISIEDQKISIKETTNFEAVNDKDINLVFTTIQGLHTRLNTPKENSLTYEDFEDKKIVLISDEAHHINAETKKGKRSKSEKEDIISWEHTVNQIFKANTDNYLLEFTATADLSHAEIKAKYQDKLLFDYPLKQFREDRYSKEVKILQADLDRFERALQAVVLSQYRRKIFEENGLHIKPVILFKSKSIAESQQFFKDFTAGIKALTADSLQDIRNNTSNEMLKKVFNGFEDKGITIENLITELKEDFSEDKCIAVDSKHDSEEKQLAVNSLEDENNEYRAVFAVDKLNEGWDVLNLFDIVRLYNTRDSGTGQIGKTTMSEAQLIGRGARYCPFKIEEHQPLYKRKYDEDVKNDLRICEELYYHSAHNPKYIYELNQALEEIGIKAAKTKQIELKLKDDFKQTKFYKKGMIYMNDKKPHDRSNNKALASAIREKIYKHKFLTGYTSVSKAFGSELQMNVQKAAKTYRLSSFTMPVLRKAMNRLPFYRFDKLKYYFPNLSSLSSFITSDKFLGSIKVEIEGTEAQVKNLDKELQLAVAIKTLDEIAKLIDQNAVEFEGTEVFKPRIIKRTFTDKTINVTIENNGDKEHGIAQSETSNMDLSIDLSKENWYAYHDNFGTSEEKYLVKYIKQEYDVLKKKYEEIYLIRNERHFQLFTFKEGRAVEPDFVLFLKEKPSAHKVSEPSRSTVVYQLFIEPKGKHLIAADKWKEDFLKQIETKYKLETVFENKEFKIIGMPFYNEEQKKSFGDTLQEIVSD